MKVFNLNDMVKGWFVGNFEPTTMRTKDVEVAVKKYQAGDYEPTHHHKIATEITVISEGQVQMNGITYGAGSIIVTEPGESTDFRALTNVTSTVVKLPGANFDKYVGALV